MDRAIRGLAAPTPPEAEPEELATDEVAATDDPTPPPVSMDQRIRGLVKRNVLPTTRSPE